MRVAADNLRGVLSEMGNLSLERHFFLGVANFLEVDAILVGEGIENIKTFNCLLASLFVPVNQIYPMIQMLGHVLIFQFFSESGDEDEWVLVAPFGEEDIVHCYFLLSEAILIVIFVYKHLRQSVYFRD